MTVGEFIDSWLKSNERPIRWLAQKAHISPGYFNQIVHDKHNASIDKLKDIAAAMDIPFVEFLVRSGIIPASCLPPEIDDPVISSLVKGIQEHPERAKKVAPVLQKILEEPENSPGPVHSLVEVLLDMPEAQRKGLLMALGRIE